MGKEEQIKKLTDELLKLLNTPEVKNDESAYNEIFIKSAEKTVSDLKNGLDVDVNVVRQIMKRVDEVYGKAENYQYTAPLFEEFNKLLKG